MSLIGVLRTDFGIGIMADSVAVVRNHSITAGFEKIRHQTEITIGSCGDALVAGAVSGYFEKSPHLFYEDDPVATSLALRDHLCSLGLMASGVSPEGRVPSAEYSGVVIKSGRAWHVMSDLCPVEISMKYMGVGACMETFNCVMHALTRLFSPRNSSEVQHLLELAFIGVSAHNPEAVMGPYPFRFIEENNGLGENTRGRKNQAKNQAYLWRVKSQGL